MFFTPLALSVAMLAFILGVLRVALGIAIATEFLGPYEVALQRFTTAASSGELIDEGLLVIFVAIVLGVLAEIGYSVRRKVGSAKTDKG